MSPLSKPLIVLAGLALLCFSACDQKQIEQATTGVQQVTQAVQQTVETVKQEANLTGSMELATTPPVAAKACYARLIVLGGGRPNVLQFSSSKDASLERFPSLFMQAQVQEGSLAELVGKTVQAEIFAQAEQGGPMFHTPDGATAPVNIVSVEGKSLTAQCSGAMLVSSQSKQPTSVSGKFVAVVE